MKEYLSRKGVDYQDHNVAADAEARQEMAKIGSMAVPTLIVNGTTIIGFDRNKIEKLLH